MMDLVSQIVISVLGIAAVVLVAKKNKWGFVLGVLSQPFWLITSYLNSQWGVFLLSVVYTFTWSYGVYEWFSMNGHSSEAVVDSSEIKKGVYRHYKGDLYEVMVVALHTESREKVVVYKPLYELRDLRDMDEAMLKSPVFVRSLDMFLEEVEVEGKMRRRFEYVGG